MECTIAAISKLYVLTALWTRPVRTLFLAITLLALGSQRRFVLSRHFCPRDLGEDLEAFAALIATFHSGCPRLTLLAERTDHQRKAGATG